MTIKYTIAKSELTKTHNRAFDVVKEGSRTENPDLTNIAKVLLQVLKND